MDTKYVSEAKNIWKKVVAPKWECFEQFENISINYNKLFLVTHDRRVYEHTSYYTLCYENVKTWSKYPSYFTYIFWNNEQNLLN